MTAYERGAYKYVTPSGHRYSLQMRVSAAQESIISQIVDYGFSQGASAETISIIATIAYKESSFGVKSANPRSNARGLFQYMPASWKDRHESMNRESHADQIVAMFNDLNYFRERYNGHLSEGKIDGAMTFPEYAYACHYKGPYKPGTFALESEVKHEVSDFHDKWLILSLQIQ
ncbi:MAG: transglycosylase SLT domain-containing protein [Luteibacter jiangsuensis]